MNVVRYTLTPDDLLRAARSHNLARWPRLVLIYLLFSALVAVGVGGIFGVLDVAFFVQMIGVALTTTAVMFLLVRYWLIPRKLRKAQLYLDPGSFEYEAEWNETLLTVRTADEQTHMKFARMAGWRQAGSLLLIFRDPNSYKVIPAHAFNDPAQRQDLINRLQAAGVVKL